MSIIANESDAFFRFKVAGENERWTIPVIPKENSMSINLTSNWTTVNVQGSTEAMSAFNYVNNPTIPINLNFHEDLWREYSLSHSYEETINKLAALQYPGGSETIVAPYVYIYFCDYAFRGYFNSMRISTSGLWRNGHNVQCEVSAQFVVVQSTSPNKSSIESSFKTIFQ